jgi:hypothetical protein
MADEVRVACEVMSERLNGCEVFIVINTEYPAGSSDPGGLMWSGRRDRSPTLTKNAGVAWDRYTGEGDVHRIECLFGAVFA